MQCISQILNLCCEDVSPGGVRGQENFVCMKAYYWLQKTDICGNMCTHHMLVLGTHPLRILKKLAIFCWALGLQLHQIATMFLNSIQLLAQCCHVCGKNANMCA